jgi:hypothetical protein
MTTWTPWGSWKTRPRAGHEFMAELGMNKTKFSPREIKFLELFFSGFTMKASAKGAGYRGSSDPALCNTGRKILDKFSNNPRALFRQAGARERRIARLLVDMAYKSKSELKQFKALKILAECIGG